MTGTSHAPTTRRGVKWKRRGAVAHKMDKKTLPLRVKAFSEDLHGIGDWVFTPKEICDLKDTDPDLYQKKVDEIVDALKESVAQEVKKYMHVTVRHGEDIKNGLGEVVEREAFTVGVKIFVM